MSWRSQRACRPESEGGDVDGEEEDEGEGEDDVSERSVTVEHDLGDAMEASPTDVRDVPEGARLLQDRGPGFLNHA